MKAARVAAGVFLGAAGLAMAGCTYAAPVDRSGIEAAALAANGDVAVAYQSLRYRPATGIAAFPDGGIPRYVRDRELIAVLPAGGGPARVLRRFENPGVHGSASLGLRTYPADPDHLLVSRSYQPSTSEASRVDWSRIAWRDGAVEAYPDLKADLARRGRAFGSSEFGDIRVIAPDGTLLIGAKAGDQDELWLRPAGGDYRLIDPIKHFYGVVGDELYYWSGDQAVIRNWRTGALRVVARYDPAERVTTRLLMDDPVVRAVDAVAPGGPDVRVSEDHTSVIVRQADGRETRRAAPAADWER